METGESSQAVLKLVGDLRYGVSRLQERLLSHRITQGEFWDNVKARFSMIEARLAGLEVRLSALTEEEWAAIQPEVVLSELKEIGSELAEMSREVHEFLDGIPQ